MLRRSLLLALAGCLVLTSAQAQRLKRYVCLIDHLRTEAYEADNPLFTKDAQGIIQGKEGYHPVRICIYGILNYEAFRQTGDSVHYYRTVRQAQYFQNPDNFHLKFGGRGIAFPYLVDYKDLKTPWYSGMAQGMAISYLLRYSELTGDTAIYPTIRKVAHFMIQPEEAGGTISFSENDGTWVEEYAGSKLTRHVLNGGINAYLGLHEYCEFFPEDTAAIRIRDAAYLTLLSSLEKFNIPGWCRYDLVSKKCSPSYMRYQIYQMLQLYELTGEAKFYRQMMLWTTMLYYFQLEKSNGEFSRRNHKLARKAPPGPGGWHVPDFEMKSELARQGNQARSYNFTSKRHLENYLERNVTPPEPDPTSSRKLILMEFSEGTRIDYVTFHFEADKGTKVKFQLYAVSADKKTFVPLPIEADQLGLNDWRCLIMDDIPENGFEKLVLVATGRKAGSIHNTQIGLYNTHSTQLPWYGFYDTAKLSLEGGHTYCLAVPQERVDELKIFWRFGKTEDKLKNQPFQPNNYVNGNQFTAESTGLYQFSIIYGMKNVLSKVGMMIYEEH